MIHSIDIRNFRCFERLEIGNCRRINLLVGDNGSGKTALLEAIFLALSSNVEVSMRLKSQRGFDTNYSGSTKAIEEAVWRDYFFDNDWRRDIFVGLKGDGEEARSLAISRGSSQMTIPFEGLDQREASTPTPLKFTWKDANGREHIASPKVTGQGIQFGVTEEFLSDFFLFAANQTVSSRENAARFSALSRERREKPFVEVFTREYPWITDLDIEVVGGAPVVHASLVDSDMKLPINSVSGGINRIMGIMLALAVQPNTVVLVDEIENGIYYEHKPSLWRGLIQLTRDNNAQMFLTTHDEEWLEALIAVSGDDTSDIALWRLERDQNGGRILRQFGGDLIKKSLEYHGEIR